MPLIDRLDLLIADKQQLRTRLVTDAQRLSDEVQRLQRVRQGLLGATILSSDDEPLLQLLQIKE